MPLTARGVLAIFMCIFEVTSAILTIVRILQAMKAVGPWRLQKASLNYLLFEQGKKCCRLVPLLLNDFCIRPLVHYVCTIPESHSHHSLKRSSVTSLSVAALTLNYVCSSFHCAHLIRNGLSAERNRFHSTITEWLEVTVRADEFSTALLIQRLDCSISGLMTARFLLHLRRWDYKRSHPSHISIHATDIESGARTNPQSFAEEFGEDPMQVVRETTRDEISDTTTDVDMER